MPTYLTIPSYNPAATAPTDTVADLGTSPAGNLAGEVLADGLDTSKTWAVLGTAWEYTGTSIKSNTATTSIASFDAGVGTGRTQATIASMPVSGQVVGVVARVSDVNNYLRLAVHTTGMYRITSRSAGVNSTVWDSSVVAAVGDTVALEISGTVIAVYVNDVLVHSVSAPVTIGKHAGTRWGLLIGSDGPSFTNFTWS